MVQIKLVLLNSNLRKAFIIQEQFQAKLNVWRTTMKTFLRSSSCFTSVSGMLQHELGNSKTTGPFRTSDKIVYLDKFSVITNNLQVRMIF